MPPTTLYDWIGGTSAPQPLAPGAKYFEAQSVPIANFAKLTIRELQ